MIEKIQVLLANITSLKKQRLSLRLLAWVVICSSFFALFMSAFQLYTDYRRDVASIHSSIQYINDSYLKSLAANAYNMDTQQLELQLQGMLKLQDIEYLEIIEKTENGHIILARQGDPRSNKDIEREFNLNYFSDPLPLEMVQFSTLRVSASLKGVYQRLWNKAVIILISNITKTFLASICIFFIFQYLITRHLISISIFAKQLNIDNLGSPLVLDRNTSDISEQDELDQLVSSINGMQKQMFTDISKQKQTEKKLRLSSRVFNDTHEGITITDAKMNIIDVNPAFSNITGYSRKEVIGQNPSILSSGKQSPEFYQAMWQQVDEHGHWQGEVWNRKKEGEIYTELLTISVLKDDKGDVVNYLGVFTDITSSKKQQEQLSLMAHYDVLTGLPNRALFTDRFTQAIAHSKRTERQLAVCFLDLDNFKPVNDNYGHEIGDQLLVEVAKRITANIREEDTASRQGGDEFALLLNDIESYTQCEQTLQRMHHALAQPFLIDDYSHKITVSSGLTLYPHDDGDIDTLLRHADQAMYQAKVEGKNRYHLFNAEHDQRTILKHHQLEAIEHALENDEFELYYQPKVNMVTGVAFGSEALIRWIHPEKGLIPPLDFLPTIEGTELELKVGNWVINQALSQLEVWHKQNIKPEVSVNISSHHLLSETFFADLDTALAKHPSVDSQCLQLEILESSALGDLNAITTVIETCQGALGVKVALDDFGTGYSSLTHLRSLPADTIKIDQSFVRDMIDDPSDYAIIDGIIGLADSFGRKVIAEGVETTNHGLMLLMMNCEEAQGYGIAKPMPADDIPQWLTKYTPNQEWQHCGNKYRSSKETKVKLFKLVTEQWKNSFINNIQSSPDKSELWPILNGKRCPAGTWIKRSEHEQLFELEGLERLDKAHEAMHLIAQGLYFEYQEGDMNAAREGLVKFQTAFDNMIHALGMCE